VATSTLCSASARCQAADLAIPSGQDELIASGPLLSDDGHPAGWVRPVLLRAKDRATARTILTPTRYAASRSHKLAFGGRPS